MNTTAAAVEASVTVETIRTWCRNGVITATKTAGRRVIDAASLARRVAIGAMRARTETPTPQEPPATHRQVDYAMNLLSNLAASDFGLEFYDGPTTRPEIAALSKDAASNLIENLKDRQNGPC
ncbi:hypothetical protein [Streptomyces sp. ME19-01-6]|uniref:hypothetical protein n=1 Tax=Streptomyces sp. ME19-01-6 TaxID=3028686 RepID=UPI0029B3918F|nr:hypothetical protein [Streptomyces sp. ME19-01-6]MDX3232565.1 hypothetical protein [Streptomyces sp. ME19-01-6]